MPGAAPTQRDVGRTLPKMLAMYVSAAASALALLVVAVVLLTDVAPLTLRLRIVSWRLAVGTSLLNSVRTKYVPAGRSNVCW